MLSLRPIFLILCLAGPYLSIFVYLKHERSQIKREIKHRIIEGIDRSQLVKLSFTEQELRAKVRWEHSKEFEFNGEWYDVVETEIEGSKVVYWCWWDNEETTLNKRLTALVSKTLGDLPGGGPESIKDFLESNYYQEKPFVFWSILVAEEKLPAPFVLTVEFDSFITEIIPPPPQC